MSNQTETRPTTQPQVDFIKTLLEERDLTLEYDSNIHRIGGPEFISTVCRNLVEEYRDEWRAGNKADFLRTSSLIGILKKAPRKPEPANSETPEGMHILRGESRYGTDAIFKVQIAVHGSGKPYAKQLVVDEGEGSFEYAPGAVQKLSEATRLPLEEAKKYGALYGVCVPAAEP